MTDQTRIINEPLISNAGMNGSFSTTHFLMGDYFGYSIHAVWSGNPVGSLYLEESNDDGPPNENITNWKQITDSVYAVNGAGSYIWKRTNELTKWCRLSYASTSGSGAFSARLQRLRI